MAVSELIPYPGLRGFLPADAPVAGVVQARRCFEQALYSRIGSRWHEFRAAARPLLALGEEYVRAFGAARVGGLEHLEHLEGGFIAAFVHPVHTLETTALLLALDGARPNAPKAAIVGLRAFSNVLPAGFRNVAERELELFPVEWVQRADGTDRVINGSDVIARTAAWLRAFPTGILAMAPNGISTMWRAAVARPLRGLELLCRQANVPIVPVAVTGQGNLARQWFDLDVTLCASIPPDSADPAGEWLTAVLRCALA
jgi:hypothetical protein